MHVSAQVVGMLYDNPQSVCSKIMFDYCVNPVVHFLLFKLSVVVPFSVSEIKENLRHLLPL